MSDQRMCLLCLALVDLDHPDITVLRSGGGGAGRTTVRDNTTGLAHTVTTKRITEKKLKAQAEEKE
jgi:hypothetical protein